MEDASVSPFTVAVPDGTLVDLLRERLARTRWAEQIAGSGWDHGTDLGFLRELCRYWQTTYDWRVVERGLNELAEFGTEVDGQFVHGFHVRSPDPGAIPLVLLHGWPSTVVEFAKVVRPLAEPARHGAPDARPFHVICPELPGFGFSGPTSARGWHPGRIATAFAEVLDRLGYDRFVTAGGDYGQTIALELAKSQPERVIGMYLTSPVASPPAAFDPQHPRADEVAHMARVGAFQQVGSGYLEIQRTRPQTVGYGLVDSPVALAAWIVDKLHAWTDCGGDLESVFTKDELITQVMMFWVTATGNSAARPLLRDARTRRNDRSREHGRGARPRRCADGLRRLPGRDRVPAPGLGRGVDARRLLVGAPRRRALPCRRGAEPLRRRRARVRREHRASVHVIRSPASLRGRNAR